MWTYLSRIASFTCPWIELIGENWQDSNGRLLEYWRTVSADSVIVIPVHNGQFLLPNKMFRPGVGAETLDFPGGRLSANQELKQVVEDILSRELGVSSKSIKCMQKIYENPKYVNSSSSSQKLYGFYVNINSLADDGFLPHIRFDVNSFGVEKLLKKLECLQCRALLIELFYVKKFL